MFIYIHILPHLNNKYKLTHHAIRDASEVLMEETEISTNIIFCEISCTSMYFTSNKKLQIYINVYNEKGF